MMNPTGSYLPSSCWWYLDLVTPDVPGLCKVWIGCPIGRYDHSLVGIVLALLLSASGFDFSQGVVSNLREN